MHDNKMYLYMPIRCQCLRLYNYSVCIMIQSLRPKTNNSFNSKVMENMQQVLNLLNYIVFLNRPMSTEMSHLHLLCIFKIDATSDC